MFGCLTGPATSWKTNFGNHFRYFDKMISILINVIQRVILLFIPGTHFCCLLLPHTTSSCLSLMSYHGANKKGNRVKGQHWRLLIHALHSLLLRNNVTCFQKQQPLFLKVLQIPQDNTCVGVSFLKSCRSAGRFHVCFSLYSIIHVNYLKLPFCWNLFLINWCHKCLKHTIDLLFYGEHFYGFM